MRMTCFYQTFFNNMSKMRFKQNNSCYNMNLPIHTQESSVTSFSDVANFQGLVGGGQQHGANLPPIYGNSVVKRGEYDTQSGEAAEPEVGGIHPNQALIASRHIEHNLKWMKLA